MNPTQPSTLTPVMANALSIQRELSWFRQVLDQRLKLFFEQEAEVPNIFVIHPPDLSEDPSMYAAIIQHYRFGFSERLLLVLGLAPHLQPSLLDLFFMRNNQYERGFTEFGGIIGKNHSGFLPTGETACFLLAGSQIAGKMEAAQLLHPDHALIKYRLLDLEEANRGEPRMSGALTLSHEYLHYFTYGEAYHPPFSPQFPAKRLQTPLDWSDLVVRSDLRGQLEYISHWIEHGDTLLHDWELIRRIKPGFRCLFYGPPGTGKTLAATLLGKRHEREVYRIDLSMVVSKYIGETEKNLASVFDQAENKRWMLFFDEADALFGKRTETRDAHDRHANQQVAYLLQRVEDFPGTVILATNLKKNLDEAFARRFDAMLYFPAPDVKQRWRLWKNNFDSTHYELAEEIDLKAIAQAYELTGGNIINVLRYCCLQTISRNSRIIEEADIQEGIRLELHKIGRTL